MDYFLDSPGLELQMKKFLNNRHSTQAVDETKCLQHLQHDFMVQQYLRETTSVHNHQSYVSLLNQISFNNKNKKRQIKHLMHQTRCYTVQSQQPKMMSTSQVLKGSRLGELTDFQKKINEQEQIKNHLLSQLNQVSKSINLMKGDVGRIIEKNESTIVLQKKTSKVRLIAQDQLKKVNLALNKDHSQILQRNNMQIRFNKKMKNICNNENNILKKIQAQYLQLEKRKKLINDKIGKMEEIMKNLNEREKTREEIKIINERNRINLEEIYNLFDLVKKIQAENEGRQQDDGQKDEGLLDTHLSLKTQRFKMKIKQIEAQIVKYISELIHSIEKTEKQFINNSDKAYQYKNKLEELQQQQRRYQNFINNGQLSVVSEEQKRKYDQKLSHFERFLNALLIIWQFIENHNDITKMIDQMENSDLKSTRRDNFPSRFYRKSQEFQKQISIVNQDNNYSNKFYKLILFLTDNGQEINLQSEFLMKSLEMTICMWFKGLKNIILQEEKLQKSESLIKKAKSLEGFKFKSTIELLEQMSQEKTQKYRLSLGDEEQDKLKTMLELISPKKSNLFPIDNHHDRGKLHGHHQVKTEGDEQCKAKRMQVLQRVDHDYYKMLKNVLQIQKENIKKNYDFNKKFNRAKFTEKNIIQEQKRFQSNFALQFIKKDEQSMLIASRRSIASKASCKDQTIRKRRDFHHKTALFQTFKPQLDSSRVIAKDKVRQSIFNAKKLQRRSRLVQRESIDSTHNKSGRTSVCFEKRAMINFAQKEVHEEY